MDPLLSRLSVRTYECPSAELHSRHFGYAFTAVSIGRAMLGCANIALTPFSFVTLADQSFFFIAHKGRIFPSASLREAKYGETPAQKSRRQNGIR